jgi:nucleotide-binding universal stress UspA family protein
MRPASWNGFDTVVCAIDFSPPSRRALRLAAAIAARRRGSLIVLFVNDPLLVSAAEAARPRFDLRAHSLKAVDRFIRTALGTTALARVERRVATGDAADQILSAAKRARADVVVVGSHGLTGVAHVAFGSTASAVLRRARGDDQHWHARGSSLRGASRRSRSGSRHH